MRSIGDGCAPSRRTLYGLLAVSVLTNVVFAARTLSVDWRSWLWPSPRPAPIGESDHVWGHADGGVDLIVYTDFECPFCAEYHAVLRDAVALAPDVRWAYRHLPASDIHPLAKRAAEASECAAEQGRFWEYADRLFARHAVLAATAFGEVAAETGLDEERFADCVAAGRHRDVGSADGRLLRLRGTPTSFVGDSRIDGLVDREQLLGAIRSASR